MHMLPACSFSGVFLHVCVRACVRAGQNLSTYSNLVILFRKASSVDGLLSRFIVCVCPCAYAGVPEDNTAANTLSYLLCQKPSQLGRGCDGDTPSSPSLGSSGGGHAANVAHWWEVLSAVQGLTQKTQQHVFTLLGAEVRVHVLLLMVSVSLVAVYIRPCREGMVLLVQFMSGVGIACSLNVLL